MMTMIEETVRAGTDAFVCEIVALVVAYIYTDSVVDICNIVVLQSLHQSRAVHIYCYSSNNAPESRN